MIYNHSLYIVGLSWYLFPFCFKFRLFANQCKCSGWEAGNKLSRFGNWPIVLAPCWQQGSDRTLSSFKLSSREHWKCVSSRVWAAILAIHLVCTFGRPFWTKELFFLNHAQHEMVKALKWWIEIIKLKSGQSRFVVVRCGSCYNLIFM